MICEGNFQKLQLIEFELNELINDKKEEISTPIGAFVSFNI